MLVFFIILGIIMLLGLVVYFSTIRVEVDTLKINNKEKIQIEDFNLKIYLAFLNKVKWLKIKMNKEKFEKINKGNIDKLLQKAKKIKIIKDFVESNILKKGKLLSNAIKETRVCIENLNLEAKIGLENVIILSYMVAVLDMIIGINLAQKAKDLKQEKYQYIITPYQTKKFYLILSLECIISVKISNILKHIIKKQKEK